jgi:hypothetical protein
MFFIPDKNCTAFNHATQTAAVKIPGTMFWLLTDVGAGIAGAIHKLTSDNIHLVDSESKITDPGDHCRPAPQQSI